MFRIAAFSQTPTTQGAPQPLAPQPLYRVGKITPPRIISKVSPVHPPDAKRTQGTVVLGLVVDGDGNPRNIRVQRSLRPDYDQQAIQAVSQWKFSPATREGRPVAVIINVEIAFDPQPASLISPK